MSLLEQIEKQLNNLFPSSGMLCPATKIGIGK